MQRKTLTQRLTLKYKLIVRNEENFADKWSLRFNFLGLLVFLTFMLILFYLGVTGINRLGAYLLGNTETEETRLLITLATRLDSLEYELETRDAFINNFKIMLEGGQKTTKDTTTKKIEKLPDESLSPEEEAFRKKFEAEVKDPSFISIEGFNYLYFTQPAIGKVNKIYQNDLIVGANIESKPKSPILLIDTGELIAFFPNTDGRYTAIFQHINGLVTQYEGLAFVGLTIGQKFKKGEKIGVSSGETIQFRMQFNTKTLNPFSYIAWK